MRRVNSVARRAARASSSKTPSISERQWLRTCPSPSNSSS
jgi:hypothetical protein